MEQVTYPVRHKWTGERGGGAGIKERKGASLFYIIGGAERGGQEGGGGRKGQVFLRDG